MDTENCTYRRRSSTDKAAPLGCREQLEPGSVGDGDWGLYGTYLPAERNVHFVCAWKKYSQLELLLILKLN